MLIRLQKLRTSHGLGCHLTQTCSTSLIRSFSSSKKLAALDKLVNQPEETNLNNQASNRVTTWSPSQAQRSVQIVGPRFEQTDLSAQPFPPAAIDLVSQEPVREVSTRVVSCNGGGGPLGHPKVYINLDQGKPIPCGYCGIRFQLSHHHGH